MKIIKLLVIDDLCEYGLIDQSYLERNNIEPYYLYHPKKLTSRILKSNEIVVDSFSYEEIYKASKELRPDYIVSLSEEYFEIISEIRRELSISGMSLEKAILLSNKTAMYGAAELSGITIPKTVLVDELSTFGSISQALKSNDIFIKPINKSGSFETFKVKSNDEFKVFKDNHRLPLGSYIAQEYIDDELFHTELIVSKGQIKFLSCRKYSSPNAEMVLKEKPIFSVGVVDEKVVQKLKDASIKIVSALNIENAVLHNEFFLRDQEPIFLETNARIPGIGLNHMYYEMLGVSFETILCLIVCNVHIDEVCCKSKSYLCGYYPIKKGRVISVDKIMVGDGCQWTIFVKEGEELDSRLHMTKSAMVICWGKSINEMIEASKKLECHEVIITDEAS